MREGSASGVDQRRGPRDGRFRKAGRGHAFVVPDPVPGRIPHVLEAGERWMGMLEQTEELVKWSLEDSLELIVG
jgi:hypothetical protein